MIEDPSNERLVSIVSVWELAIKVSLGRLIFAQPFAALLSDQLQRNSMQVFGVTLEHGAVVATLPFHHRDPFDRMLIAQAIVEGIPIIGVDSAFDAYGVTRLW